jgi:hypothetical protein
MSKDRNHTALIFLAIAGSILLFPIPAYADTGLGWLAFTASTAIVAFYTMGIGFVAVVLIEALVLMKFFGLPIWKVLWLSFLINLASTLAGVFVGFLINPILIIAIPVGLVAFLWWWWSIKSDIPVWVSVTVLGAIFAFPVPLVISGALLPEHASSRISDTVLMFSLMLPGFGLSVFLEGLIAGKKLNRSDIWKGIVIANVISYLILVPVTAFYTPPYTFTHDTSWMSRAKGTLRSTGSAELAYQRTTRQKLYGSYQELRDTDYIAEGYTPSNMIENYSMSWEVHNISTAPTEEFPAGIMSTFTIIAYPRDTRPGYLLTFGIGEDQVVRVYNPDNDNDPYNLHTWDPIL